VMVPLAITEEGVDFSYLASIAGALSPSNTVLKLDCKKFFDKFQVVDSYQAFLDGMTALGLLARAPSCQQNCCDLLPPCATDFLLSLWTVLALAPGQT
jgi:hypothetical protein